MPARFLQQVGGRWGLQDHREAVVLINCQFNGDDLPDLVRGLGIVLFTELHEVNAMGTEGCTNGRCRAGFTGRYLQFNNDFDFLCHDLLQGVLTLFQSSSLLFKNR